MMTSISTHPSTDARAWLEVDLEKIKANYRSIQAAVGERIVIPVLKANAYGLGMLPIAQALMQVGATCFGVAEVREALELHRLGAERVQVLGGVTEAEIDAALEQRIILPISSLTSAYYISQRAIEKKVEALCEVLIDTGMGRLGLWWCDAIAELAKIVKLPQIKIEGVYSHFPHANADTAFSCEQIKRLEPIYRFLEQSCGYPLRYHIANSDGINNIPPSVSAPFTAVRTGINLYGVYDMHGSRQVIVQPALALKSRIIAIKNLPEGTGISYGCTEVLTKPTKVGTIALGCANGLPLALSKKGSVMVHGTACRVLGRVTMDYTIIDLSLVPETHIGDVAECLGEDITVHDWAQLKNTHEYEIICSLGNRVERLYT